MLGEHCGSPQDALVRPLCLPLGFLDELEHAKCAVFSRQARPMGEHSELERLPLCPARVKAVS